MAVLGHFCGLLLFLGQVTLTGMTHRDLVQLALGIKLDQFFESFGTFGLVH